MEWIRAMTKGSRICPIVWPKEALKYVLINTIWVTMRCISLGIETIFVEVNNVPNGPNTVVELYIDPQGLTWTYLTNN